MANSMGSLYIGAAGIKQNQNAINTTANNLSNVNTTGYVRQQVLFTDRNYITFARASISDQQSGLGVTIGDVVHARDIFLDKSYRQESGRQSFYENYSTALTEIQEFFQEMEGTQYQSAINNFWTAIQTLANDPSDTVNQNLVIQKASLFLSRTQAVTKGLEDYQDNINVQIRDSIDRVNEIGEQLVELNKQIQRVEAGQMETAMTLRDQRDTLLDELGAIGRLDYSEQANGVVKVNFEGVPFVTEMDYHKLEGKVDKANGFITPFWPHLSVNYDKETNTYESYKYVYNFDVEISSALDSDIGSLKALVLARGSYKADYSDLEYIKRDDQNNLLEDMDEWTKIAFEDGESEAARTAKQKAYSIGIGASCMMNTEAEIDKFFHEVVTAINDAFCPNTSGADINLQTGTMLFADAACTVPAGTVTGDMRFLDENNCYVGSDGALPPKEIFVRAGCERYTTVYDATGKAHYLYNEEDLTDPTKMYTTNSVTINTDLKMQPSLLPGYFQNGEIAQPLRDKLATIWTEDAMSLNQIDTEPCTFKEFYNKLISDIASKGTVYETMSTSLEGTVQSVENQRQQVIGVSSDEELQSLIKYQNAYNAASRYMNVVSEMIETIINNL